MLYLANFSNFGITNFTGELAALSAAILWAITTVVWSRLGERIPPLELNLLKGVIALVFIVITLFFQGELLGEIDRAAVGLLLVSGVIGIGIADTAFFAALNLLGPRRTLLIKILTSPTVALLALLFLREQLTANAWCGILLTLLGVAWVISERVPDRTETPKHLLEGIGWVMLSILGDATGAILSRVALTLTDVTPLESTGWRILAGVVVLLMLLIVKDRILISFPNLLRHQRWMLGNNSWQWKSLLSAKFLGILTLTSFAGTYLGIWLQQISFKFAVTGVAQTLIATSPLFVLPISLWMGERISIRAILGVAIALSGVAILFGII